MPGIRRITENDKKMMAKAAARTPAVINDDEGKKEGSFREAVPSVSPGFSGSPSDGVPASGGVSDSSAEDSKPAGSARTARRGRRKSASALVGCVRTSILIPESLHKLIRTTISVLYLKGGKKFSNAEIVKEAFLFWLKKNEREVYDDFVSKGFVKD